MLCNEGQARRFSSLSLSIQPGVVHGQGQGDNRRAAERECPARRQRADRRFRREVRPTRPRPDRTIDLAALPVLLTQHAPV